MWFSFLVLQCFYFHSTLASISTLDNTNEPTNIILFMLDDLGRADIGALGAEWDTPNIDQFISDSITLSHHYIGYVCSASRSQFLTGRYSFHNGYGTLDVFDIHKGGALPQGTATIFEYLKHYSNYKTYGIGKWMLGSPTESTMPKNRGLDKFIGFNGGMEYYFSKERKMTSDDSTKVTYLDFWEDLNPSSDYSGSYSTDQYISKTIETIDSHVSDNLANNKNEPFFVYTGLQAIHKPFPDSENKDANELTNYYTTCKSKYLNQFSNYDDRLGVCEAMLGIDEQFGKLLNYFQSSEQLRNIWKNTIIIFTSDNGGAIDAGSCNYPLRGGKNTFYEGNQRVLAFVGGGKVPESRRGVILDGLFSNVDWFPTILAFANIVPKNIESVSSLLPMLDGYNMYNYLMSADSSDVRDHIMFHLLPSGRNDANYIEYGSDLSSYKLDDMDEIAIVFYDESGILWKYFDTTKSTNPIGDPIKNSMYCSINDNDNSHTSDKYIFEAINMKTLTYNGLFDITNDESETASVVTDVSHIGTHSQYYHLIQIIDKKVEYFVNYENQGSKNSRYLFGNFDWFTQTEYLSEAVEAAEGEGAWVPFMTENELSTAMQEDGGLDQQHPIYTLHTSKWELPQILPVLTAEQIEEETHKMQRVHEHVPLSQQERRFKFEMIDTGSGARVARNVESETSSSGSSASYLQIVNFWNSNNVTILFIGVTVVVVGVLAYVFVRRNTGKHSNGGYLVVQ